VYLRDHADLEFSHGLCPDCRDEHYPQYREALAKRKADADSAT
jgi:hypothetical protein